MTIDSQITRYYQALREGEPLEEFFVEEPKPVKFGITEALHGYDDIAEGLRQQTETTSDWVVRSYQLETDSRDDVGWFSDHVIMRWREDDELIEWESRWSGTLLKQDGDWKFVRMHVSAVPE